MLYIWVESDDTMGDYQIVCSPLPYDHEGFREADCIIERRMSEVMANVSAQQWANVLRLGGATVQLH